ncbi:ThuA domain-containing protein [Rathayibacter sp. VKM Ac-2926]|uniref:ThuA domain-containing protein n=1 Tax=Rathayibacter sp. VKM Ac-2926 TaxID=2929477 RepID=UPI001FB3A562|nr:ThuA domain-containing protein [Rathayibacter sp. VKM Ac-2926]MCJ1703356.1 ThuA domain-containing protein [Rathayibacter sp. VKM Ac-2926]
MTALLLRGDGRYADPWHPFAETAAALAALLSARGHQVEIRGDVDQALADLGSGRAPLPDLLVVDVGQPRDGGASPLAEGAAALALLDRSAVPVLGIHVSSTSFGDSPEWAALLGGRWVRGTTMHPDYGPACIAIAAGAHPITAGLDDFDVQDERYSWLEVADAARILATHEHDGERHPIAWALEREGGGRTVYDALGHDAASYSSPGHVRLLTAALDWLEG